MLLIINNNNNQGIQEPIKCTNAEDVSLLSNASLEVIKITWFTALDERSNMNKLSVPLKNSDVRSGAWKIRKQICAASPKPSKKQLDKCSLQKSLQIWNSCTEMAFSDIWVRRLTNRFKGFLNKMNFLALFRQSSERSIICWFLFQVLYENFKCCKTCWYLYVSTLSLKDWN